MGRASYDIHSNTNGGSTSDTSSGTATETVDHLFIDVSFKLNSNNDPINIQSYTVRSGENTLKESGVESENPYVYMYLTGMKQSLRERIENTFLTNVKVQMNQAVQAMSA